MVIEQDSDGQVLLASRTGFVTVAAQEVEAWRHVAPDNATDNLSEAAIDRFTTVLRHKIEEVKGQAESVRAQATDTAAEVDALNTRVRERAEWVMSHHGYEQDVREMIDLMELPPLPERVDLMLLLRATEVVTGYEVMNGVQSSRACRHNNGSDCEVIFTRQFSVVYDRQPDEAARSCVCDQVTTTEQAKELICKVSPRLRTLTIDSIVQKNCTYCQ
jgi:hypothetical protein